jgi:DNA repair exonuclease SbcCD ATPase subunit
VLFREGSSVNVAGASSSGGFDNMPLIDRIKSLFARKGETEKKIAVLSEQKTAFAQQLDRSYEEIGALEKKEQQLRDDFKNNTSALTRRRVTSQLVQLRKDIERRQQLVSVLNQRVNVVSTHLHNLELVRQGQTTKLPDAEELANDAAAAEEMLAELQASNELADGVGGGIATAGMSSEEQALYEELEREADGPTKNVSADPAITEQPTASTAPGPTTARAKESPKRAEPEPG